MADTTPLTTGELLKELAAVRIAYVELADPDICVPTDPVKLAANISAGYDAADPAPFDFEICADGDGADAMFLTF